MKQNYIIPLFIPHYGCPHVCIFCNQKKITGQVSPITPQDVRTRLAAELALISPKRLIEVAFYGGSFTALPLSQQNELLAPATELLQLRKIHSIRLSTRPDCISRPILENLRNMGVSIIELGVQSLDDEVLLASERGHKAYHVFAAVEMLKEYGFSFGIQLMPGLPKEDSVSLLRSAVLTASLRPDMVRLYPVIVLADTPLAKVYQQG
ncbi:MAG: radical SAM protein, partial [Sporomusaceae bacterium]|nr:radical SAM protein [Sporomusaceae bacterium]